MNNRATPEACSSCPLPCVDTQKKTTVHVNIQPHTQQSRHSHTQRAACGKVPSDVPAPASLPVTQPSTRTQPPSAHHTLMPTPHSLPGRLIHGHTQNQRHEHVCIRTQAGTQMQVGTAGHLTCGADASMNTGTLKPQTQMLPLQPGRELPTPEPRGTLCPVPTPSSCSPAAWGASGTAAREGQLRWGHRAGSGRPPGLLSAPYSGCCPPFLFLGWGCSFHFLPICTGLPKVEHTRTNAQHNPR